MWSFQLVIILLFYRVRFIPITIRRYHRSSVGVILLRLSLSGFQIFKFATDRLYFHRVFDSTINVPILNQISQNQIWDPGILNSEIGDDGMKLGLDLIHQERLILYPSVMGYYLSVRKQIPFSSEFGDFFMPMTIWKNATICYNNHYVKESTEYMWRGYWNYLWLIVKVIYLTVTGVYHFPRRITIYGEAGAFLLSALVVVDDVNRKRIRRSNQQHVWVYGTITKIISLFSVEFPKSRVLRCNGWIADFVFRKRKRWYIDKKTDVSQARKAHKIDG